jgi:hypothetical protein
MNTGHLSEMEIQQFAFDNSGCGKHIIEHMALCNECVAKATDYQLMFSEIKHLSKPVFDFDLSGLVLKQLPKTQPVGSQNFFFFYFIVTITMGAIGVAAYIFRAYILRLFAGILPMAMYLMLLIFLAILVFQGIEMYKKYQKQMQNLNSY